jgi:hypothetical protein
MEEHPETWVGVRGMLGGVKKRSEQIKATHYQRVAFILP